MATVRIMIDLGRSQQVGVKIGNVDAEIVREFIDARGRARLIVSVNSHEFEVARPIAVKNAPVEWATQEELVAEYNSSRAYRRELNRAGGDATLLRR
jgi:hypothetical protein